MGHSSTAELPDTTHVHIEHLLPFIFCMGLSGARQQQSGIVDQYIQATKVCNGLFHQLIYILRISGIGLYRQTIGTDLLSHVIELFLGASGNNDLGAFMGKSQGNAASDTAATAGDNRSLTVETHCRFPHKMAGRSLTQSHIQAPAREGNAVSYRKAARTACMLLCMFMLTDV